jgi:IS1 family transposase
MPGGTAPAGMECLANAASPRNQRGAPYYRLQHSRNTFDEVAQMAVEGVSIATSARVKRLSWNTVARWRKRAAETARSFNDRMTHGYELRELQADEIRTFVCRKDSLLWVFVAMEVWSRLWPAVVVGRRSYRSTKQLMRETANNGLYDHRSLITTDGFQYYTPVIRRIFGLTCIYGQVMKQWCRNRVRRIDRKLITGSETQLDETLYRSEDSQDLNTSFVERLNLTIRQGSAYLFRHTPCHARRSEALENHLELLRCYYNFIRPHRGLKFGKETRTPAMQAGLASRPLTFRQVFTWANGGVLFVLLIIDFRPCPSRMSVASVAA